MNEERYFSASSDEFIMNVHGIVCIANFYYENSKAKEMLQGSGKDLQWLVEGMKSLIEKH